MNIAPLLIDFVFLLLQVIGFDVEMDDDEDDDFKTGTVIFSPLKKAKQLLSNNCSVPHHVIRADSRLRG